MGPDPADVVRTMWSAAADDRLDDFLATLHPDIVWRPGTRPGLSMYAGHDGVLRMRETLAGSIGDNVVVIDDIVVKEEDVVICRGRVVSADHATTASHFGARCVVRQGLITEVDTYSPDEE